jgi:hypothetical protein
MLRQTLSFPGIEIQPRDLAFFRALFECRVLTLAQAAAISFDGKKEAAKKRVQKLKAAGLVNERARKVYHPSLLSLTPKSLRLLEEHGILADYPPIGPAAVLGRTVVRPSTLAHELEVADVKAGFHSAIAPLSHLSLVEFSTWPLLNQFEAYRSSYGGEAVLVKPDGFIRIREQSSADDVSEYTYFLEVDRSTETQDTLVTRAGCYLDYYKSGGFAVRNRAPRSAFKDYPFRVLMVFKTAERRNNTAERLLQHNPPILTQVCLTTFEEVKADPLGKIWIRPLDYREAVKGTPFASVGQRQEWRYRRQTERDMLVETTVKHVRILEE